MNQTTFSDDLNNTNVKSNNNYMGVPGRRVFDHAKAAMDTLQASDPMSTFDDRQRQIES